jgi:superfamily II DNA or RNA helicase
MTDAPLFLDFQDDAPAPGWRYRDYQVECLTAIEDGWKRYGRQLCVLATGMGKTILFSAEAHKTYKAGGKTLILADREELVDQAIDKLARSTGLIADKEKAESFGSLDAPVVVASVQTLFKDNRLFRFPSNHFSLVISDECDLSMAPTHQKVLRYFHFGVASLAPEWKLPTPDVATPYNARILGVSATIDRASLGTFYQHRAFEYNLKHAVQNGWCVKLIARSIPVEVDMRGIRMSRTPEGTDFSLEDIIARVTPFVEAMSRALVKEAGDRRTIIFVPSVIIAKKAAEVVRGLGFTADFVSGDCPDRSEKIARFRKGQPQYLFNALLMVRGYDDPGVRAVSVWRVTERRAFYTQLIGRGCRPLEGLLNGLDRREDRVRTIRESAKPDLLIIDPLWLSDKLSLVKSVDLVAGRPEIREQMLQNWNEDLIANEEQAERDFLVSLARAAAEHQKKKARTIDPLDFAVATKDEALQKYEAVDGWEMLEATPKQLARLSSWGIDTAKITCRGQATRIIEAVIRRRKGGLCSPGQMRFLQNLGYRDTASMTSREADAIKYAIRQRRDDKRAGQKLLL